MVRCETEEAGDENAISAFYHTSAMSHPPPLRPSPPLQRLIMTPLITHVVGDILVSYILYLIINQPFPDLSNPNYTTDLSKATLTCPSGARSAVSKRGSVENRPRRAVAAL